jgi:S1-C subfamily serine protease
LKASEIIATTSPLFLLGYNHGPSVAKTTRGIKVQLTKGEATQESDDYRVLYSIPTLPGSSGGPVFDTLGRLVAINYCGLRVSDTFNYGIISQHLDDLLHTAPNLKVPL